MSYGIIFVCYCIGSIPSAVWIGKFVHGIDIREHGSKNAGATNTFRVFGKKSGAVVLFLDVAKGYLAASFPLLLTGMYLGIKDEVLILQLTASFCAIIGHVFPVFAHFRGGKGVASSLGIIIAVNPDTAFICLTSFLLVPLTLSYLDAENYGIWLTLSSFIAWFSFFDIGLGNGLRNKFTEAKANGDMTLARAYVSSAYFTIGGVCLLLMLVFFGLNFFIDWTTVFNTNITLQKDLSLLMPIVFGK